MEGGAQGPKSNFLDCRLTPSPVSPDAAVAATASAFAEEALSFCPRCLPACYTYIHPPRRGGGGDSRPQSHTRST